MESLLFCIHLMSHSALETDDSVDCLEYDNYVAYNTG